MIVGRIAPSVQLRRENKLSLMREHQFFNLQG